MIRDELKFSVPVRQKDGVNYVRLADIPNPYRSQFSFDSYGSTMPLFKDEGFCHYSSDWDKWLSIRFSDAYRPRYNEDDFKILTDDMINAEALWFIIEGV